MFSRTPSPHPASSAATVEQLESRRLLAATVSLDRGILTIVGDAASDHIEVLYDSPARQQLLVTVNGANAGGYPAAGVGRVSIDGGAGDDVITTDFRGRSILRGGPGDDSINGGGGDDQLFGDAGNDTILGNRGRDVIYGGDGNDVLSGGTGPDVLIGEGGDDSVVGSAGDDRLFGDGILDTDSASAAAGNDTLAGSEGRDTLYGGLGADLISGGPGTQDLVNYSDRSADLFVTVGAAGESGARGERDTVTVDTEKVNGGAGNDVLQGSGGRNVLYGGPGNDVLIGEGGADSLFGAEGNDSLAGGSGSDLLDGGVGTNDLEGGDGNDTLNMQRGAADTYDAGGGTNTVNAGPDAVNRALAQPQSYANPAQDADWPDPTIVRVGDTFLHEPHHRRAGLRQPALLVEGPDELDVREESADAAEQAGVHAQRVLGTGDSPREREVRAGVDLDERVHEPADYRHRAVGHDRRNLRLPRPADRERRRGGAGPDDFPGR